MSKITVKSRFGAGALALLLATPVMPYTPTVAATPRPEQAPEPQLASPQEALAQSPLYFEPNLGQTDPQVRFVVRGAGAATFLTDNEMVTVLRAPLPTSEKQDTLKIHDPKERHAVRPDMDSEVVRMRLAGAAAHPAAVGLEELPSFSSYFIGDDESKWLSRVANYSQVGFTDVYPNIDLVYHGTRGQLEYDFIVQPGADPSRIALQFEGATARTEAGGDLLLSTRLGEIRQHRPKVYQTFGDRTLEIPVSYSVRGDRVEFSLGAYDRTRPLVIDPVVSYSTFLGGSLGDYAEKIAVDSTGAAYVVGTTYSVNFPTKYPYQTKASSVSDYDVFITKLSPSGSGLAWSTYLGGNYDDDGLGLALENNGATVYVTGSTLSTNFPTVAPYQRDQLDWDAFVSKLTFSGSALALSYSTYLGGNEADGANAIAVRNGYVAVTGWTLSGSSSFPTLYPLQTNQAYQDAFVTIFRPKLAGLGVTLYYSTFLGGSGDDSGRDLYWDGATGDLLVVGFTCSSTGFPQFRALQTYGGACDAFVTRIASGTPLPNPPAPSFVYSTYLGGHSADYARAVGADASGAIYVAGSTDSDNFPTWHPYFGTIPGNAGTNGFISKIFDNGSLLSLQFSTYFGGGGYDEIFDMVVDPSGSALWICLDTQSDNLPVVNTGWWWPSPTSSYDSGYVARFGIDSSNYLSLFWSGYLGGGDDDSVHGLARQNSNGVNHIYVTGATSSNFVEPQPIPGTNPGGSSAFVIKIDD